MQDSTNWYGVTAPLRLHAPCVSGSNGTVDLAVDDGWLVVLGLTAL